MSGLNIKIAARAELLRRGFEQLKPVEFGSSMEWDFLLTNPLYVLKTDAEKTNLYANYLIKNGYFRGPIFGPDAPTVEISQLIPRVSTFTIIAALSVMGALLYLTRKGK